MAGKRKRHRPGQGNRGEAKRQRTSAISGSRTGFVVKDALLVQYYPRVLSLREYLLSKLPPTSKIRRKKISTVGRKPGPGGSQRDQVLAAALDHILIGISRDVQVSQEERWKQWTSFSQRADTSASTLANLSGVELFSQSEIVDFAIWLLFSKSSSGRVQHLLCQGFRKDASSRSVHRNENITLGIPSVLSVHPNSHVVAMKAAPWPQVLALMGKEGERAMIDLLLDCGIFLPVENGRGNYHQLSGQPLGELKALPDTNRVAEVNAAKSNSKQAKSSTISGAMRTPANIVFVRNRMLYARAALNAQGGVRFGLRHIHVLNRHSYHTKESIDSNVGKSFPPKPQQSTIYVMMYIFPRQFGLHNVFTHDVDHRETVQPFKDYTLREDEINKIYPSPPNIKIPKRLRGKPVALVQKLQILHTRCPYKKLLEYYCPIFNDTPELALLSERLKPDTSGSVLFKTQEQINITSAVSASSPAQLPQRKSSLLDRATPSLQVSAFCRAVLTHLIPREFWGYGETQKHNEKIFFRNVDRFITLRRFESLSLHEVSQGTKLADVEWLHPPDSSKQKLSLSDVNKRLEIIHEFIYYLFDSILIPLIRTNFHVTESNTHRYRLLYFRQDVWRSIAEPEIASLKVKMFEEVKLDQAQNILSSRTLGFSQVRLLPKETGVRPIMNLRRRTLKQGYNGLLGTSINTILAPIYNVLTLERVNNPSRLGSSLFSIGDLYAKLKSFQSSVQKSSAHLYFAKVDVKAAFDTIPQNALLRFMSTIPSKPEYRISRHVEIKPGVGYHEGDERSRPIHKWTALAKPLNDIQNFEKNLEFELAVERKNTVFVENIVHQTRKTDELLALMAEHIKYNIVKIGKKYYRQKEGIPQGSVLSSLLCNYFYADLEMQHLQFLQSGESLLLRLIDDFLLITTNAAHAKQFLQIMHDGLPTYGVRVNPNKTLANFETTINGKKVPRLVGTHKFPYCGSFIDTKNLNLTKDRERKETQTIMDSLTVEYSKMPGRSFHRKVLSKQSSTMTPLHKKLCQLLIPSASLRLAVLRLTAISPSDMFKIQSHSMFFDMSLNLRSTVLLNIYNAFTETATKMWSYARSLPAAKQPTRKLVIKTIRDVVDLAFILLRSKSRKKKSQGFKCAVSKIQVEWLAITAFKHVLGRRQSRYREVLAWLDTRANWIESKESKMMEQMRKLLRAEVHRVDDA